MIHIGQCSCSGGSVIMTGSSRRVSRLPWNTCQPVTFLRGQRDRGPVWSRVPPKFAKTMGCRRGLNPAGRRSVEVAKVLRPASLLHRRPLPQDTVVSGARHVWTPAITSQEPSRKLDGTVGQCYFACSRRHFVTAMPRPCVTSTALYGTQHCPTTAVSNIRDFRLPPLCRWDLRSSGTLRSVDW